MKVPNGLAGPPHLRPGRIARPTHRPGCFPRLRIAWSPGRRSCRDMPSASAFP